MTLLALALACAPAADDTEPLTGAVVTDDGLYRLALSFSPEPPIAGEVTLSMVLTDPARDTSVAGAELSVVPYMPAHGHGIDGDVIVEERDDGLYQASWVFSMPGLWELETTVVGDLGTDFVVIEVAVD